MKINMYYNSSESNKIGKSLKNSIEFEGTLRNESGIVNPVVLVKSKNPSSYNYCYIPEFKRYYFIEEMVSVRNGLWKLSLKCDVLESFKAYYMNLNCVIDKQESLEKTNKYFNDGTFATTEETFNEIIQFPNQVGLNSPVYLLTCVGGGSVVSSSGGGSEF